MVALTKISVIERLQKNVKELHDNYGEKWTHSLWLSVHDFSEAFQVKMKIDGDPLMSEDIYVTFKVLLEASGGMNKFNEEAFIDFIMKTWNNHEALDKTLLMLYDYFRWCIVLISADEKERSWDLIHKFSNAMYAFEILFQNREVRG
jgi:hypothetical protein